MAKKICLYSILSAFCIVLGFLEHLVTLDFIAPGVKLGLANTVALLLIAFGDIKGAFAVNIVRILISTLLFSSPYSLLFSLSGGIVSLIVVSFLRKSPFLSLIGFSVLGAVAHNLTQLVCAHINLGSGVWYYSGILLFSALSSGLITGYIATLISKKLKLKH